MLAMADPLDFETIAAVRGFCRLRVKTALAGEQEIADAIEKYYGQAEQQGSLDLDADPNAAGEDLERL